MVIERKQMKFGTQGRSLDAQIGHIFDHVTFKVVWGYLKMASRWYLKTAGHKVKAGESWESVIIICVIYGVPLTLCHLKSFGVIRCTCLKTAR